MSNEVITTTSFIQEAEVTRRFLDEPNEQSFANLFRTFSPQLVAFFRTRGCGCVAEDLAQDVMLTVYRNAVQVRDRSLFRAWLFKIARNALSRHWGKQARDVETVDLADLPDRLPASSKTGGTTPAFEFLHWMAFLESREREALILRFVEQWEYHEIAAALSIPIGTVQWRVHMAKRKLAPHLKRIEKRENPVLRTAA